MWFEEEEIIRAKHMNIVDVMTTLGYTMKPWSGNQFYWDTHDSFKAKDFLWYWNSKTMGGNAVDLLIKCFDYTFVEAVRTLLDIDKGHPIPWQARKQQPKQPQVEKEKPVATTLPFQIPIKNKNNERVLYYLCQIRGLSKKIVQEYIADGYIYEEKKTHNAIFIGKNSKQEVCYAFRRGTIAGKKFAGDVEGSDKHYAFAANTNSKTDTIYLFEAAIDALSYLTLHPDCKDRCQTLAGTSLFALQAALMQSKIKNILIATDNDETGERIYKNILALYGNKNDGRKQNYNIQRLRPTKKDVNEDLLSVHR